MLRSSSTEHSKNSKRKCVRMHVPINDSLISNRSVRNSWKQRRSSGADFERKISIISPLRLAIHLVQNHHAGEQKSHWDKTNKGNYHLKLCMSLACLSQCNFCSQACRFCTSYKAFFFFKGGPEFQSNALWNRVVTWPQEMNLTDTSTNCPHYFY